MITHFVWLIKKIIAKRKNIVEEMQSFQGCKLVLAKMIPIGPLNLKRRSKPKNLGSKWTILKLVLAKKVPIGPLNLKRRPKPKKLGPKWTILKGNLHP